MRYDMTQYNKWSEMKRPDEWTQADIPSSAGHYQLLAVDTDGELVVLDPQVVASSPEANERLAAARTDYAGVIYIGKASDLHDRFWKLVRSWRSSNRTSQVHESRKTWDASKDLQAKFPANRMRCRFMPLGHTHAGKRLSTEAKKVHDAFSVPDDDARKTNQPTAAAIMTNEASELIKYVKCMGYLPPLNTKPPDRPDALPDAPEQPSSSELQEIDNAIEMGDPDGQDVRRAIDNRGN